MGVFWEQVQARERPTVAVRLRFGDTVAEGELRALLPAEWQALCEQFPAEGEDAQPGQVDTLAMRDPLIAASFVAPDDAPPKRAAWWAEMADSGHLTAGELDSLFDAAWRLNRAGAVEAPDLGKG